MQPICSIWRIKKKEANEVRLKREKRIEASLTNGRTEKKTEEDGSKRIGSWVLEAIDFYPRICTCPNVQRVCVRLSFSLQETGLYLHPFPTHVPAALTKCDRFILFRIDWMIDRWRHICFHLRFWVKTDVAPSINRCCSPQNCSSESEIQQMALQFWKGPYGGSNQLSMKNGYDHHDHELRRSNVFEHCLILART